MRQKNSSPRIIMVEFLQMCKTSSVLESAGAT